MGFDLAADVGDRFGRGLLAWGLSGAAWVAGLGVERCGVGCWVERVADLGVGRGWVAGLRVGRGWVVPEQER